MRKIKEVLRLHFEAKISQAKISAIAKISRFTVQQYIIRFTTAGLNWPLDLNDEELERKLFSGKNESTKTNKRPEPDYLNLLHEIRKPDATLAVLWEEYKQQYPDGYQYSYFCDLFNAYRKKVNYSMRQEHKAGEKTFIDFGDSPIKIIDFTGKETSTKIFVCVWGASNYMFAQSCFDEKLSTWIRLNINALEYFGCCPKAMVPDNLKSAVSKASRYEPDINPTYAEFAEHYGTVIFPARPYRPKDKSKAENGVKLAKRWILFRLRNEKFYSLTDLNQAIGNLLTEFNRRMMKKFQKSRKELFELLDKPHALNLPDSPYEYAEWKKAKVQFNYHIAHDLHNYSVPYTFIHKEVDIKATSAMIEVYCRGKRICSHRRNNKAHGYTTVPEHMPPSHRKYLEWTPDRILRYAEKYGSSVKALVQKVMESRKFPEQAYKSCLGIIRLENNYGADRLNLACQRALEYGTYTYNSVVNILQKGLDRQAVPTQTNNPLVINHENIRGANYYNSGE